MDVGVSVGALRSADGPSVLAGALKAAHAPLGALRCIEVRLEAPVGHESMPIRHRNVANAWTAGHTVPPATIAHQQLDVAGVGCVLFDYAARHSVPTKPGEVPKLVWCATLSYVSKAANKAVVSYVLNNNMSAEPRAKAVYGGLAGTLHHQVHSDPTTTPVIESVLERIARDV